MENRSKKLIFAFMCVFLAVTMILGSVIAYTPGEAPLTAGAGPEEDPTAEWDMEQIIMNKYATDNGDGSFKLTIETYAAGEVTYTPTADSEPADVVVLLDVSSSMSDNSMKDLSGGTSDRSDVAKQALQNFISDISEKYSAQSDFRMSIVTFGASANQLNSSQAWYNLDTAGASALSTLVGNYTSFSSSTTNHTVGLTKAQELFAMGYTGANTARKQVVVLFTDGVPADSGDSFTEEFGENGVTAAKALKDAGVEIFCVGIFDGANSSVIRATAAVYDDQYTYTYNGDGTVASWTAEGGTIFSSGSSEELYAPVGNRFLNFVSSNYPKADKYGITYSTGGGLGLFVPKTYTFTVDGSDPTRASGDDQFFYAAADATQIDEAFSRIVEWIAKGGTTVQLKTEAEVRDIISDYFQLKDAAGAENIVTYTRVCTGGTVVTDGAGNPTYTEKGHIKMNYTFGDKVLTTDPASPIDKDDVTVTITGFVDDTDRRNVSVSGFDYESNYVAYDTGTSKAHGLLFGIEFDIVPIEGFNGGNQVPTNNALSGIYLPEQTYPLKNYPEPDVSIELEKPECKITFASEIVLYQGGSVSFDDIFDADVGTSFTDAFVKRTVKYNGVVVKDGVFAPEHTTYYGPHTLEVTLEPITVDGSDVGTLAEKVTGDNDQGFTIYVLEPTVTVSGLKDTTSTYGAEYTLGSDEVPSYSVVWAEPANSVNTGTLKVEANASTAIKTNTKRFGTKSDLSEEFELHYTATGATGGKITLPKAGATVNSEAYFKADGTTKVSDYATVKYETKNAAGTSVTATDGSYKVSADTCTLTITTDGGESSEVFFYAIYKDGSFYTTVASAGSSSVTLKELPVGTYKAVPNTDWSWKYNSSFTGSDTATLSTTAKTGTVTCKQTARGTSWISSISTLISNVFGKGGN